MEEVKDIEERKKEIERVIKTEGKSDLVLVEMPDGSQGYMLRKLYELSQLGAYIQPKVTSRRHIEDEYNCGPYGIYEELKATKPRIISTSGTDKHVKLKRKDSAKKQKIDEIVSSKESMYDEPGTITIKIYPEFSSRVKNIATVKTLEECDEILGDFGTPEHFYSDIVGEFGGRREDFFPEAIDILTMQITPRELAKSGLLYTDMEWERAKKVDKGEIVTPADLSEADKQAELTTSDTSRAKGLFEKVKEMFRKTR